MKTFDLRNNRIREYERKEQINKSGKSEADFIIAKLAEDLYKPMEIDEEAWAEEIKNL